MAAGPRRRWSGTRRRFGYNYSRATRRRRALRFRRKHSRKKPNETYFSSRRSVYNIRAYTSDTKEDAVKQTLCTRGVLPQIIKRDYACQTLVYYVSRKYNATVSYSALRQARARIRDCIVHTACQTSKGIQ